MSVQSVIEKVLEIAGKLLMAFILFFAVGFVYGVVKTKRNRIHDILPYVKIEYVDDIPSSLSVTCSSSRPSHIYNIGAGVVVPDPAAKEEALSSLKPLITEIIPSNTGPLTTAGAGLLGFGTAWEAFKKGHGNIKDGLIIVFGSIFGAPLGYYVSSRWMKMNCPSEDLFQQLDRKETWTAIVDSLFLKYYNYTYSFCLDEIHDRSAFATVVDKMRSTGFDVEGRHYTDEDFRKLKVISAACQK